MSRVLIGILGITSKEVSEVEKNKDFTNNNFDSNEVGVMLYQIKKFLIRRLNYELLNSKSR